MNVSVRFNIMTSLNHGTTSPWPSNIVLIRKKCDKFEILCNGRVDRVGYTTRLNTLMAMVVAYLSHNVIVVGT